MASHHRIINTKVSNLNFAFQSLGSNSQIDRSRWNFQLLVVSPGSAKNIISNSRCLPSKRPSITKSSSHQTEGKEATKANTPCKVKHLCPIVQLFIWGQRKGWTVRFCRRKWQVAPGAATLSKQLLILSCSSRVTQIPLQQIFLLRCSYFVHCID